MVILSRRLNEAVVFGDRFILTVARLLLEGAELTIQEMTGGPPSLSPIGIGDSIDIGLGVRMTLVEIGIGSCGMKARLGFDVPANISLYRKEVWDDVRGPSWYPHGAGGEPSPN
jgi:sRNA-binding carbon storage regulator CsrA